MFLALTQCIRNNFISVTFVIVWSYLNSDEEAKKHLHRFLFEAQGLSSEVLHILNVCLLAVQCMEVHKDLYLFEAKLILW